MLFGFNGATGLQLNKQVAKFPRYHRRISTIVQVTTSLPVYVPPSLRIL
jgi:hypothetical protein